MKFRFSFLLFSFLTSSGFCQAKKGWDIDAQHKACLDSTVNQTTAGMLKCTHQARDSWDKELNKNYKLLMVKLSPEGKEKLKGAQVNWLAYRDSEYSFSGTTYHNLQGTLWLVIAADRQVEIVKTRAIELKAYYDILSSNK